MHTFPNRSLEIQAPTSSPQSIVGTFSFHKLKTKTNYSASIVLLAFDFNNNRFFFYLILQYIFKLT